MTTIASSISALERFKSDLFAARKAVDELDTAVTAWDAQLKAELKAKEAAKKEKDPIDVLEEKLMKNTAVVAAAAGTPEQAKDMLAKARARAIQTAADGADTGALEEAVRQMEHLAKVAEENRHLKNKGVDSLQGVFASGAAQPKT